MAPDDTSILILSGPTASGKTAVAMVLARLLPLEIVNADSVQVYRGLDIGTAKPTPAERRETPHHLIDVADPDEDYDAGRFVAESREAIGRIRKRDRFPLLVGGTGMYIRALLRGLDPLPRDRALRARLLRRWEEEGGGTLYDRLRRLDPASAARIHPADQRRILRALEIAELTGQAPSRLRKAWGAGTSRYRALFLALVPERALLYARIEDRVDRMIAAGLVDEVRGLLARGYPPGLKSLSSLGYRHVVSHLAGGIPLHEAVAAMKRDTKRYAKRQTTWLAGEEGVVRLAGGDAPRRAAELAKNHLF